MRCPQCDREGFTVADSRPSKYGPRRRRVCGSCGYELKTIEVPENDFRNPYAVRREDLMIIREAFDRIKSMARPGKEKKE